MKNRLKEEGSEVVTKCDQLKMEASDGKKYLTDAANPETLLRLIQLESKTGRSVITSENYLPPAKKLK